MMGFLRGLPDGLKVAFISRRDGQREIYVMEIENRNLSRVTKKLGRNSYPVWSPDGTRIAFMSDRNGDEAIYIMNSDGTNLTRLTN